MEEGKTPDNHLTSAAAFVEGGIQDACDDACSICLEEFCESDPSTVTNCKHEFHLQCVLEWCQRSSKCPMCWQTISLKDQGSQELLDAVKNERIVRMNPARNTTILGFELQHLPVSATEAELEERIIQHLAAAAAMGRARQIARRESQGGRASGQGRPHFLLFSSHPNGPSAAASVAGSPTNRGGDGSVPAVIADASVLPLLTGGGDLTQMNSSGPSQVDQASVLASGSTGFPNPSGSLNYRRSPTQSTPSSQDEAGPSDFHSFSESLKSRITSMSTRYKESITKSTRGWRERLFSRTNSPQELSADGRTEGSTGVATLSQMMEHMEARDSSRTDIASVPSSHDGSLLPGETNQQHAGTTDSHPFTEANVQAQFAVSSGPN